MHKPWRNLNQFQVAWKDWMHQTRPFTPEESVYCLTRLETRRWQVKKRRPVPVPLEEFVNPARVACYAHAVAYLRWLACPRVWDAIETAVQQEDAHLHESKKVD